MANISSSPSELTAALIKCETVTPDAGSALDLLSEILASAGFQTTRLPFSAPGTPDVDNLFARFGSGAPHICFAGHVDVVPPGDETQWRHGPFKATIDAGHLYGRGAVDMKGAIGCFAAAAIAFARTRSDEFKGSISFLITGDEEGPAINGTVKVLDWMAQNGQVPDHCLLGEPTNPEQLGDMVKIGRRGSLNGTLSVVGTQGHVAYPQLAQNPVPVLLELLNELLAEPLDDGSENFQPSNLEITSIDVNNQAVNIIPRQARAMFNIRYNDKHSSDSLRALITARLETVMAGRNFDHELVFQNSGEWFLAQPGGFVETVARAIKQVTGRAPELSTSGGTSDGRFITHYCPVVEFGLVGQTMHKIDEHVSLDDLDTLTRIYTRILESYFELPSGSG